MKKWCALWLVLLLCVPSAGFAQETEPCVIEIPGNPTTGYTWAYEVEEPDVVAVEETFRRDEAEPHRLGVGGVYVYTLTGLREGYSRIVFSHARHWNDEPPIETVTYLVRVDEDGSVKARKMAEEQRE